MGYGNQNRGVGLGFGATGGARNYSAAPPPKIPSKYNKRSTLTAEVKAGRNTFDFALESK